MPGENATTKQARFISARLLPWAVLVTSLGVTLLLWRNAQQDAIQARQAAFSAHADNLSQRIQRRLDNYKQMLQATRAFYLNQKSVEHSEFEGYVAALDLATNFPGVQGISFAPLISRTDVRAHEQAMRRDGLPDYAIRMNGNLPLHAPVAYIAPLDERNRRALGYDNLSNPTRRATIERARDLGRTVITEKLQLVQDGNKKPIPGFLMFLPVYRNGMPRMTEDERRAALAGWLAASFRAPDLMADLLKNNAAGMDLDLYDGETARPEALLFESNPRHASETTHHFHATSRIEIGEHHWLMQLHSLPSFDAGINRTEATYTAAAGTLISLLLALLTAQLVRTRELALQSAENTRRELQDRRAMEMELADSEQRWKFALDGAGHGVWDYDVQMGRVTYSDQYLKMLGYSQEDYPGNTVEGWKNLIHPDDRTQVLLANQAHLDSQSDNYAAEYRLRCKNGEWKWITSRGMVVKRDAMGKALRMIGTHTDIDERRAMENDLKESKEFSDALINSLPGTFYLLDQQGRHIRWNRNTEIITGYSTEELSRLPAEVFIDEPDRPRALQKIREVFEQGEGTLEADLRLKDGSKLPYFFSARRTMIAGQLYLTGVGFDISERRRTEEDLRNAVRAKTEFLANMSHEIRTPMNSVIGMAQLALRHTPSPEQRDYLEKILLSGEHLLGIIDDILDFSKIEAGKLRIETLNLSISDIAESISNLISGMAQKKGLHHVVEIDPAIPSCLRGDALRLRQVLLNLASNAVKFTEQGEIRIVARQVEADSQTSVIRFEVRDTGIGLSADAQSRLFKAFQQGDGSVTRKYGGTGLGLVISQRLVALMNGDIGVSSQPGNGSTFWFQVRLQQGEVGAATATSVAPFPRNAMQGTRILLAEDHPLNQQVAAEILEQAGAIIVVANNGGEALDLMQKHRFDAVLMDVQMPIMDGREATRLIRQMPSIATTPIIAMTAHALEDERQRCLDAGMDAYLTKPIRFDQLHAALARWLPDAGMSLETPPHFIQPDDSDPEDKLVDFDTLEKMMWGDRDKMQAFSQRILKSIQESLANIDAAAADKDWAKVKSLGHYIKSPAQMIDSTAFVSLSSQLETSIGDGNTPIDLKATLNIIRRLNETLKQIEIRIGEEFQYGSDQPPAPVTPAREAPPKEF